MERAGRVLRQLLVAALLAAVVVTCLRLGWWQWQRYHSTSGSLQNLGYTLQWPTFAAFAIFMWWRLSRLERQRREEHRRQEHSSPLETAGPAPVGPQPRRSRPASQPAPPRARLSPPVGPPEQPVDVPDDPDDAELAAYNRYLAQLHAADTAGGSNGPRDGAWDAGGAGPDRQEEGLREGGAGPDRPDAGLRQGKERDRAR